MSRALGACEILPDACRGVKPRAAVNALKTLRLAALTAAARVGPIRDRDDGRRVAAILAVASRLAARARRRRRSRGRFRGAPAVPRAAPDAAHASRRPPATRRRRRRRRLRARRHGARAARRAVPQRRQRSDGLRLQRLHAVRLRAATARAAARSARAVRVRASRSSRDELAPGDLLFFSTTDPGASHVGDRDRRRRVRPRAELDRASSASSASARPTGRTGSSARAASAGPAVSRVRYGARADLAALNVASAPRGYAARNAPFRISVATTSRELTDVQVVLGVARRLARHAQRLDVDAVRDRPRTAAAPPAARCSAAETTGTSGTLVADDAAVARPRAPRNRAAGNRTTSGIGPAVEIGLHHRRHLLEEIAVRGSWPSTCRLRARCAGCRRAPDRCDTARGRPCPAWRATGVARRDRTAPSAIGRATDRRSAAARTRSCT